MVTVAERHEDNTSKKQVESQLFIRERTINAQQPWHTSFPNVPGGNSVISSLNQIASTVVPKIIHTIAAETTKFANVHTTVGDAMMHSLICGPAVQACAEIRECNRRLSKLHGKLKVSKGPLGRKTQRVYTLARSFF